MILRQIRLVRINAVPSFHLRWKRQPSPGAARGRREWGWTLYSPRGQRGRGRLVRLVSARGSVADSKLPANERAGRGEVGRRLKRRQRLFDSAGYEKEYA